MPASSITLEVQALAKAIADHVAQPVPISRAWWSSRQIAAFLDVTPKYVVSHLSTKPGFPAGKRLPSDGGHGRVRWKASEVISWWERQK